MMRPMNPRGTLGMHDSLWKRFDQIVNACNRVLSSERCDRGRGASERKPNGCGTATLTKIRQRLCIPGWRSTAMRASYGDAEHPIFTSTPRGAGYVLPG